MQLKIENGADGVAIYKLIDNGSIKNVSEALVRYRIEAGAIENAYIDTDGSIRLKSKVDIVKGITKSTDRMRQEVFAAAKVMGNKYRIIATIRDNGSVVGYKIKDDTKGTVVNITKNTGVVYTSIGAIVNARIKIDERGNEELEGIGIDFDNLAKIDKNGGIYKEKKGADMRVSDALVLVDWKEVVEETSIRKKDEHLDKRCSLLDGLRYPRLEILRDAKISVTIDNKETKLFIKGIDSIVNDDTTELEIEANVNGKNTIIKCENTNYMEVNAYMVAIMAFVGIRKINRKSELTEVDIITSNGRIWRMFFADNDNESDGSNTSIEINSDMLKTIKQMYSLKVASEALQVDSSEQNKLIQLLKIGKARVTVKCENETYTIEDMALRVFTDSRIDFKVNSNSGETWSYFYGKLADNKVNIKNIIIICAAAVVRMDEIKYVVAEALDRELSYRVEFTSNIRI